MWNPWILWAILRFSLNPKADLRVISSSLSECQWDSLDSDCHLHNLCLSHFHTEIWDAIVFLESWSFWKHRSEHRSVCICFRSSSLISDYSFSSSWNPCVWGEILGFTCKSLDKSSDFRDFINLWIYQIYLSAP